MEFPSILPTDGASGMMAAVVQWLQNPLSASRVHLYQNDYVPTAAAVPASFTEPVAAGLGPIPMGVPTVLPIGPGGRVIYQWPQSVWTASGAGLPQIVFGYWVSFLDPVSMVSRVGWAQRFQSQQGLWTPGQTVKLMLSLGGKMC